MILSFAVAIDDIPWLAPGRSLLEDRAISGYLMKDHTSIGQCLGRLIESPGHWQTMPGCDPQSIRLECDCYERAAMSGGGNNDPLAEQPCDAGAGRHKRVCQPAISQVVDGAPAAAKTSLHCRWVIVSASWYNTNWRTQ
jgi:hypothetical protein